MSLSPVMMNKIAFTGSPDDNCGGNGAVRDTAFIVGGAGAAAGGAKAFRAFPSGAQVSRGITMANQATEVMVKPINQSKSLWNALKVNTKKLTSSIANWAKNSKMPKFMKAMFTGKFGKAIGGLAAVFVFITGVGEVVRTAVYDLDKISTNRKAA